MLRRTLMRADLALQLLQLRQQVQEADPVTKERASIQARSILEGTIDRSLVGNDLTMNQKSIATFLSASLPFKPKDGDALFAECVSWAKANPTSFDLRNLASLSQFYEQHYGAVGAVAPICTTVLPAVRSLLLEAINIGATDRFAVVEAGGNKATLLTLVNTLGKLDWTGGAIAKAPADTPLLGADGSSTPTDAAPHGEPLADDEHRSLLLSTIAVLLRFGLHGRQHAAPLAACRLGEWGALIGALFRLGFFDEQRVAASAEESDRVAIIARLVSTMQENLVGRSLVDRTPKGDVRTNVPGVFLATCGRAQVKVAPALFVAVLTSAIEIVGAATLADIVTVFSGASRCFGDAIHPSCVDVLDRYVIAALPRLGGSLKAQLRHIEASVLFAAFGRLADLQCRTRGGKGFFPSAALFSLVADRFVANAAAAEVSNIIPMLYGLGQLCVADSKQLPRFFDPSTSTRSSLATVFTACCERLQDLLPTIDGTGIVNFFTAAVKINAVLAPSVNLTPLPPILEAVRLLGPRIDASCKVLPVHHVVHLIDALAEAVALAATASKSDLRASAEQSLKASLARLVEVTSVASIKHQEVLPLMAALSRVVSVLGGVSPAVTAAPALEDDAQVAEVEDAGELADSSAHEPVDSSQTPTIAAPTSFLEEGVRSSVEQLLTRSASVISVSGTAGEVAGVMKFLRTGRSLHTEKSVEALLLACHEAATRMTSGAAASFTPRELAGLWSALPRGNSTARRFVIREAARTVSQSAVASDGLKVLQMLLKQMESSAEEGKLENRAVGGEEVALAKTVLEQLRTTCGDSLDAPSAAVALSMLSRLVSFAAAADRDAKKAAMDEAEGDLSFPAETESADDASSSELTGAVKSTDSLAPAIQQTTLAFCGCLVRQLPPNSPSTDTLRPKEIAMTVHALARINPPANEQISSLLLSLMVVAQQHAGDFTPLECSLLIGGCSRLGVWSTQAMGAVVHACAQHIWAGRCTDATAAAVLASLARLRLLAVGDSSWATVPTADDKAAALLQDSMAAASLLAKSVFHFFATRPTIDSGAALTAACATASVKSTEGTAAFAVFRLRLLQRVVQDATFLNPQSTESLLGNAVLMAKTVAHCQRDFYSFRTTIPVAEAIGVISGGYRLVESTIVRLSSNQSIALQPMALVDVADALRPVTSSMYPSESTASARCAIAVRAVWLLGRCDGALRINLFASVVTMFTSPLLPSPNPCFRLSEAENRQLEYLITAFVSSTNAVDHWQDSSVLQLAKALRALVLAADHTDEPISELIHGAVEQVGLALTTRLQQQQQHSTAVPLADSMKRSVTGMILGHDEAMELVLSLPWLLRVLRKRHFAPPRVLLVTEEVVAAVARSLPRLERKLGVSGACRALGALGDAHSVLAAVRTVELGTKSKPTFDLLQQLEDSSVDSSLGGAIDALARVAVKDIRQCSAIDLAWLLQCTPLLAVARPAAAKASEMKIISPAPAAASQAIFGKESALGRLLGKGKAPQPQHGAALQGSDPGWQLCERLGARVVCWAANIPKSLVTQQKECLTNVVVVPRTATAATPVDRATSSGPTTSTHPRTVSPLGGHQLAMSEGGLLGRSSKHPELVGLLDKVQVAAFDAVLAT